MQNLVNWSEDSDYKAGVALLKQYDPKNDKIRFFEAQNESKPGELHYNMLKHEIERIIRVKGQKDELPKPTENKPVIASVQPSAEHQAEVQDSPSEPKDYLRMRIITDNPYFKYEELSPEMKELYTEIKDDYIRMKAAHEKAKLAEISEEDRKHAINIAAQIEDGIQAKYKMLDDWINDQRNASENDTAEDAKKTESDSSAAKLIRLENVRSYISRETKKLSVMTPEDEGFEAQQSKVEALKAERDELVAWKKENNL